MTERRLALIVVSGFVLATIVAARADGQAPRRGGDRTPFVGAWRLTSLEEPGADGRLHAADCTGMFIFTDDGHAAVQVMYRNETSGAAGPVQYARGGYEATFGRYDVDETTHTFTYHVDGGLVRALVGKDLRRSYEFTGNRLTVRSTDPVERWRVVWERQGR